MSKYVACDVSSLNKENTIIANITSKVSEQLKILLTKKYSRQCSVSDFVISTYITKLYKDSRTKDVTIITSRAIEDIYSNICYEVDLANQKRETSPWTTSLGDYNTHRLSSHSSIKLNAKYRKSVSNLRY